MKKELDYSKKQEVTRYIELLKQEDEKYDFESTNLNNLEQQIVRLYKKKWLISSTAHSCRKRELISDATK